MKSSYNNKGFTLIELLIIMAVLGILSSVFVISSVSMTASAEASRIINNLYALKMATLTWRKEHMDLIGSDDKITMPGESTSTLIQNNTNALAEIASYIDGDNEFEIKTDKNKLSEGGKYGVFTYTKNLSSNNPKRAWYVGYHLTYTEREDGVRDKIRSKVASPSVDVRLGGAEASSKPKQNSKDEKGVWLKVLGDNDWEPTN